MEELKEYCFALQSNESMRTKMKMEKDLAKVKNIMEGLSKEGARLQEVMSTLRKGAPGAGLGPGKPVSTAQSSKYTSVPL